MSLYQKIAAFFKPVEVKAALTEEEEAVRRRRLQEDPGAFVYEEDGFCYPFEDGDKWLNYMVLYERDDCILPESNKFYAWFRGVPPMVIVQLFEEQGWAIRKAGWTEWEMTNTWSELHVEPDSEGVLLNGLVAWHPNNVEILDQLMDGVGAAYQYEIYDAEKNLLLERRCL